MYLSQTGVGVLSWVSFRWTSFGFFFDFFLSPEHFLTGFIRMWYSSCMFLSLVSPDVILSRISPLQWSDSTQELWSDMKWPTGMPAGTWIHDPSGSSFVMRNSRQCSRSQFSTRGTAAVASLLLTLASALFTRTAGLLRTLLHKVSGLLMHNLQDTFDQHTYAPYDMLHMQHNSDDVVDIRKQSYRHTRTI